MGNVDKDLQEIIDVIAGAVKTAKEQLADGFQYTDIFAFVPVLSSIPTAIKGNENAWAYLKDMTEQKENDLVDAIVAKLGEDKHIREIARRLIRTLSEVYMLILTFSKAADATV